MERVLSLLALMPSPYSDVIKNKLLHLLYANFRKSGFVALFVSSLLTYALWSSVDLNILLSWYFLIASVTLYRIVDTVIYFRRSRRNEYALWYRHFTIGVLVSALLWAAVPLLFFSETDLQTNFFIAFVILGMASGAITTLAADLRLSHIYLYGLLLPLLYSLWQFDTTIYTVSALMSILYLPMVSSAARKLHDTLIETYHTLELYAATKEKLVANEKRLSMMFEQAPVGIFYYNNDLTILDCNIELEKIMQASREQLIGLNLNQIPDTRPLDAMRKSVLEGKQAEYEGPYHTKVAELDLSVKVQLTPLLDINGKVHGGLCMMEDKTLEHAARKEAEFLSLHDHLTGLPNRKLLKERMERLLIEQERYHGYSALLFLDLDHFKQINDSLGHNIGDLILIETAHRLKQTLRKSDTLSRLGGDEFVILLPHLSENEEKAIHHAYDVSQKIHQIMSEAFPVEGQLLFSSTSIGVTLFDADLSESDEILRRADMAMYQSKAEGRKRTSFYDHEMDQEMQSYIEMKKNLRHAVERNEFSLHFQPILSISDNKTVAAETLLRWEHKGEFISTADLIKVAEESSLINEIGYWVIEQTCKHIRTWQDEGCFTLDYVTINISARQLLDKEFCNFLLETIEQYNIEHKLIKLEITETALITNFDKAKEVIDRLNTTGIDFIIDDFGTGYSSLSYLKMLPFSALKIDKSFVKDILTDPEDEKLIRAIIHTAEQFDYQIIAEGIEEEAQRSLLKEIHPSLYYQGYIASKPLTVNDFQKHLRN
ncbi:MAG: EAL domain-containing protein [Campylobacterota bacterium]